MPEVIPASAMIAGLAIFTILCAGLVLNIRFLLRIRARGIPFPRHAGRLLRRPWYWQDALWLALVMAVFIGTLALIGQILDHFAVDIPTPVARVVIILQNLITQGLALGLVIHLCRRNGAGLATSLGGPRAPLRSRVRQAFLFYVAAMPLIAAAALLSNALVAISGIPPQPQPILGGFIDVTAPLWFKGWLIATATIVAPVVEEVIFRGVFFPAIARQRGIPAAIVTVSMLFAVIHGHLPAILPLFVVGTFLSASYLYTGSLLVPILMHSIFNTVNVAAILLSGITLNPT
jgi:membrane protease YdiL (CAAX protease family)